MTNFLAFTLKSNGGFLDKLRTDTLILSNYRKADKIYTPKMWRGLWDTGASRSSITQRIVDDLELIPIGNVNIRDIIKHGDFSITNKNNKTTFSFRTPSVQEIDYVKEGKENK